MSKILAIDPGNERSGWVEMIDEKPIAWGWDTNLDVRLRVDGDKWGAVAIEYMRPRGMPTSQDEMDTMFELGRMTARLPVDEIAKVSRKDVKMFLLGRATGTDQNIRQALIDLFGGDRHAIGGIKCKTCKGKGWNGAGRPRCMDCHHTYEAGADQNIVYPIGCGYEVHPGVLHGVTGHAWSALGVGVTYIAAANSEVAM
jgi:hypothetical protein